jgi:hypothetical protein
MLKTLIIALCLASACATTAKSAKPEGATARVPDSVEERIAAQRRSDPKIDRDAEEHRWGTEEARARTREAEAKRQAEREQGGQGVDVKKPR